MANGDLMRAAGTASRGAQIGGAAYAQEAGGGLDPAAIEKMRADQRQENERFQRQNTRSNLLAELIRRGDSLETLTSRLAQIDRLVEYAVTGEKG